MEAEEPELKPGTPIQHVSPPRADATASTEIHGGIFFFFKIYEMSIPELRLSRPLSALKLSWLEEQHLKIVHSYCAYLINIHKNGD